VQTGLQNQSWWGQHPHSVPFLLAAVVETEEAAGSNGPNGCRLSSIIGMEPPGKPGISDAEPCPFTFSSVCHAGRASKTHPAMAQRRRSVFRPGGRSSAGGNPLRPNVVRGDVPAPMRQRAGSNLPVQESGGRPPRSTAEVTGPAPQCGTWVNGRVSKLVKETDCKSVATG